ncbi:DNA damage-binding protein CMR1 isoform X1 [Nicotiana tomentosiformis]|uniref:DNA damage-binding protein CMR1 isoform X1 n=1 Tax=Nicotiana tomentosiformis TaxID=4098 RepID=UPI00051C3053|nr:DNA damage-binding protein cmr1 isoform X1 [Nicotiana tomentosiformis]XP_009629866.1 DNA damage-binding protein cmr1 isoform X1 [Nicotiana tomentosiformis]XP_033508393.1 DNA damage-binding protein cmr1 isoform X1 [Nicotiana tomentosiformis]XP_033508394.1 DNA damage-binding protein cmr1 isoform X1 [Nicotiana tomentosiformis]XP_033508395.1 DNA damage-binding protein cmr1 isoform X1 [Nicotiana tomentosiformis]
MADNKRAASKRQRSKRDEVEATSFIRRLSRRSQGMPPELSDGLIDKIDARKLSKNSSTCEEFSCDGMVKTIRSLRRNDPLLDTTLTDRQVDLERLELNPNGRTQVVKGAISDVKFLPAANMKVIFVGDELGYLGLWNVDFEEENGDNGIYLYQPHQSKISGIVIEPFSMLKIFTSSYDQRIMLLDVEKEAFEEVYQDTYAIYSICHRVEDINCLYFGDEIGALKIFDVRASTLSSLWKLHEERINTIHCKPDDPNIVVTSSADRTFSVWDLRSISRDQPKSLTTIRHGGPIHSAYFSPFGSFLATTSSDNTIGIFGGENYEEKFLIHHNNLSGEYISTLRGIWGWDDSYVYIGKIQEKQKHKRKEKLKNDDKNGVDVISTVEKKIDDDKNGVDIISTVEKKVVRTLQSDYMHTVPYRLAAHPYMVGTLAGATGKGKVCMWVKAAADPES